MRAVCIFASRCGGSLVLGARRALDPACVPSRGTPLNEDKETAMPEKRTRRRAQRDKAEGKAPSTQAGEYVREEIHHVREGKHGARSAKQAIAIGLSKARRAGVSLPAPEAGKTSESTRRKARSDSARGRRGPARRPTSARRSRASEGALRREGRTAGTRRSLSRQGKSASARRAPSERSAAAKKAVRTKGPAGRKAAAKKAARRRAAHAE